MRGLGGRLRGGFGGGGFRSMKLVWGVAGQRHLFFGLRCYPFSLEGLEFIRNTPKKQTPSPC